MKIITTQLGPESFYNAQMKATRLKLEKMKVDADKAFLGKRNLTRDSTLK